jgi:hypothetical protein
MPYFLAILTCFCLSSCCSITSRPSTTFYKQVPYEKYNFFNDGRSPDHQEFNQTLKKAIDGSNKALTQILSWAALTSGKESTNYALFLKRLQKNIGEPRFIKAFDSLHQEDQGIVKTLLYTIY